MTVSLAEAGHQLGLNLRSDESLNRTADGKKMSIAEQVRKVGNSVCPPVAEALVRANLAELAHHKKLNTMQDLKEAI